MAPTPSKRPLLQPPPLQLSTNFFNQDRKVEDLGIEKNAKGVIASKMITFEVESSKIQDKEVMKLFRAPALVSLVITALLAYNVHAISQVSRRGRYLYTADGSRFYIKGVAYQQQGLVTDISADNPFGEPSTYIDPLADAFGCAGNLPYLQQLGVNTVRVYSVDSTKSHDSCMSAFSGASILCSIDRSSPAWSTNLLDQYLATIDAFSEYDNVLAVNVGNEVSNSSSNTNITPFVKAAARDIKTYLTAKKSNVLIGYAAIDGADNFRDWPTISAAIPRTPTLGQPRSTSLGIS